MVEVTEWLDRNNINVVTVVGTVAILIVAAILILVLSRVLQRWLSYLQDRLHLTDATNVIISRIVVAVLWTLTAAFAVRLSGVWAVLVSIITVIGVGFLATWAMISNFTASFFLVLWRPFHFGKTVEILPENLKGQVADRNLMFTTLRLETGTVLQIPNNLFFQTMFRVSGHAVISTVGLRKHADLGSIAPEMRHQAIRQFTENG